ncbi:DUF4158 domain-containing protein [Streptosporangium roseum]|uniref:DUF4158 domain-containing protein n=1 Tax=Streptosporangium roseum TaxID=2001 RepID=UPI0031E8B9B2
MAESEGVAFVRADVERFFLADPEDVPAVVVDYVAEQLGLDASALKGYGEKEARWDHQKQIREAYGFEVFEEHAFALACWIYRRAWSNSERPIVLLDLLTHRLVEAEILLPGISTVERLVSEIRERVALRQYKILASLPSPDQKGALEELVTVAEGRRISGLDRLRKSPTDVSGAGVGKALERDVELRGLGASAWDLSAVPAGKVAALALPGRPAQAAAAGVARILVAAALSAVLTAPLALAASIGRGYLAAVGVLFVLAFAAQGVNLERESSGLLGFTATAPLPSIARFALRARQA